MSTDQEAAKPVHPIFNIEMSFDNIMLTILNNELLLIVVDLVYLNMVEPWRNKMVYIKEYTPQKAIPLESSYQSPICTALNAFTCKYNNPFFSPNCTQYCLELVP